MSHAFLFDGDPLFTPVTVIAHDTPEAFGLFWRWAEHNALDLSGLAEPIVVTPLHDLSLTPQLADAVQSGKVGIARWVGHHEGWVVTASDDDAPAGQIAPPETPIGCFVFSHDDYGTLHVFAETMERAIATLHLYSLDQNGWDAEYDDVVELSPWALTGPMVGLREEMFDGITGVGMQCEDGFWRIFPADYDPPLRKRDGSERPRNEM